MPMQKVLDLVLLYLGYGGAPSWCRVRAWQDKERPDLAPVVVATEMESNEGTSVTNAAPQIATAAYLTLGCPPAGIRFFEHYDERKPEETANFSPERLARVEMDWIAHQGFAHPRWSVATIAEVEELIEGPLDDRPTTV